MAFSYFFTAGHVNYIRYGMYYLCSKEGLAEVLKCFMNDEAYSGVLNAIWSDMFPESTLMRYGRAKTGIIVVSLKYQTLK